MEKEGKLSRTTCGDAELVLISSRDFIEITLRLLRAHDSEVFGEYRDKWTRAKNLAWMERIEALS